MRAQRSVGAGPVEGGKLTMLRVLLPVSSVPFPVLVGTPS
jgi:hypothetical protein